MGTICGKRLVCFWNAGLEPPIQLRSPDLAFPMGEGPPAPLGCLQGRSPAKTCRHTRADRRARLRQTILLPVHPIHSIRRSQGRVAAVLRAIKSHSMHASCSDRRFHAQTTASSALAARLFPHSPPNPTFALLAEYRGLPATRMAEQACSRADLEFRCKVRTRPAKPVHLLAKHRATGRCEESRRSDGKATRLRSFRADLALFRACHACLGRPWVVGAVQVAPTPRIRPREVPRHGGSEAHGASKSRPSNPGLKLAWSRTIVLVRACFVPTKLSSHLACCGW
jgi:hypothetical protein